MVDKKNIKINMDFYIKLLILAAVLVILPVASANTAYLMVLQSIYGSSGTSCNTCHTSPPALNSYGTAFRAVPNYSSDPNSALISIGAPPGVVDTIPPETNISGVIENGAYEKTLTITLSAADNAGGSGISETVFIVNGGPTTAYTAPFVVDSNGMNVVAYWSVDKAGNIEMPEKVNFTILNGTDLIPPETTVCGVVENGTYDLSVAVCFNAQDNPGGLGVSETIFAVNGGPTSTYVSPFVVDTPGQNNISYWSTDNAGNVEPQKLVNFTIINLLISDIVPPQTIIWGVEENGLYHNNVTVSLDAFDNPGGSGVNETIFTINGGATSAYTAPFVVDIIGANNISYWSIDKAGNNETMHLLNFSFLPEINATREIENISIIPGDSIAITVKVNSSLDQAMALRENVPEGWNITFVSDDPDGFKNSTNEWIWFSITPEIGRSVTYTLTPPPGTLPGTYEISGTILDEYGVEKTVEGNNTIVIDMIEYYRRLGNDPSIIEAGDLLAGLHDYRNNIAPPGFDRPLNTEEIGRLVNEWMQP